MLCCIYYAFNNDGSATDGYLLLICVTSIPSDKAQRQGQTKARGCIVLSSGCHSLTQIADVSAIKRPASKISKIYSKEI